MHLLGRIRDHLFARRIGSAARCLEKAADVTGRRKVRVLASVGPDRARQYRSALDPDRYQAPEISGTRLRNCVLDAQTTGLIVRGDGTIEPWADRVARYYVDTSAPDLPDRLVNAATGSVSDPVLHVFHRSCGAYGHFILDGLSVVALLRDFIRTEGLKLLIPAYLPDWATRALVDVGIAEDALLPVDGAVTLHDLTLLSTVSMSNCFFPNPRSIAAVRTLAGVQDVGAGTRRLYLSREGAFSPRHATNEQDVTDLFVASGFEVVHPARLGFREQIELFSQAGVIAGNHGSAFANMVFAPPGAHVVDLMPEHWIDVFPEGLAPERWLLNLTAACGHDYTLILSPSTMEGAPLLPDGRAELPTILAETDLGAVRSVLDDLAAP